MIVKPLPKENCYELVESIWFWVGQIECEIPVGFVSDGASIPKLFWTITTSPFHPNVIRAAFEHDYLYRVHVVSRKKADERLKLTMLNDGVSEELAETIFSTVRTVGGYAYRMGPQKPLIGV